MVVVATSCTYNSSLIESEEYENEEVAAYNSILNEIADTTNYYVKEKIAVFFLFDTLTELDNSRTAIGPESENEYLEERFEKRKIDADKITGIDRYKFVRATRYPKDSLVKTTMNIVIQDEINLKETEYFTQRWLTFSRICFDKDLSKGFLYFSIWCGNLCSQNDRLDIEKVDGKWKVKARHKGPIS